MSTERASLDGLETYQRVSQGCIVSRWPVRSMTIWCLEASIARKGRSVGGKRLSPRRHIILLAGLFQIRLQFPIDDLMDKSGIVHDCEMGTLADVHLQTQVGETSPAQRVVARHIGIALCREARNWNFPWRFAHELVVGRHLKFGAHDRQYQLPQFGVTEQLVRRLNIEMANELGEHIIGLRVSRQADAKFRQLQ